MQTIKLNNETFTEKHNTQIRSLLNGLAQGGYCPEILSISETHITIEHFGDEADEVIKMMIFSKNGELVSIQLED